MKVTALKTGTTNYNGITMTEQLKAEVWGLLFDLNLSSTKESQITFSYSRLNYLNAH